MSELTHDDVRKILKIMDEMGDRDIHLEIGELKLDVSRSTGATAGAATSAPLATPASPSIRAETAATSDAITAYAVPSGHLAVRAPTTGTFYRASGPGAKPYVEVGDHVAPEDSVCVFEVMKLFTTLKAGVAGTITAIPLANETPVEQDQPLIVIKPD